MAYLTSSIISGYKSQNHNFEPYRTYNWALLIEQGASRGPAVDPQQYLALAVETGQNPNVSAEEITLGFGNDKIYLAGQEAVEPLSITFRDFMEPAIAKVIKDWWIQRYNSVTGAGGFASIYKKQGMLLEYSQKGSHQRSWDLEGIWPQAINFGGTLDHNTSDIVRVECTFRYDRAIPRLDGAAASGNSGAPGGAPGGDFTNSGGPGGIPALIID